MVQDNNATVSHDSLPDVMAGSILVQVFQNLIIKGIKFHYKEASKIISL